MSPRPRAPHGAGRFRRTRADASAARRFDPPPSTLPRRSARAAPTSVAGPGAPRGPKGSASPRRPLQVRGQRVQKSAQHAALGVVDPALDRRARPRGNQGGLHTTSAARPSGKGFACTTSTCLGSPRRARFSRAHASARGSWSVATTRLCRAARARLPAHPSRCRCRRPRWTATSRRARAQWRPDRRIRGESARILRNADGFGRRSPGLRCLSCATRARR